MPKLLYVGKTGRVRSDLKDLIKRSFPGYDPVILTSWHEVEDISPAADIAIILAELPASDDKAMEPLMDLRTVFPESCLVLFCDTKSPILRAAATRIQATGVFDHSLPAEERLISAARTINLQRLHRPRQFSGTLTSLNLVDLLQILCIAQKTSILELVNGKSSGRIFIRQGEILHAETESQTGRDAIATVFLWTNGRFTEKPFVEPNFRTIKQPWDELLMDLVRTIEEATLDDEGSGI